MSDAATLRRMIEEARRVAVFTGAGISTESGIPDFRGTNGVWSKMQPILFQDFIVTNPAGSALTLGGTVSHLRFEGVAFDDSSASAVRFNGTGNDHIAFVGPGCRFRDNMFGVVTASAAVATRHWRVATITAFRRPFPVTSCSMNYSPVVLASPSSSDFIYFQF